MTRSPDLPESTPAGVRRFDGMKRGERPIRADMAATAPDHSLE
ncbi:hypothetical protein [Burkholderia ubonensis]|nr:hypothetical protein [Burkholderia ubonensis]